jgi:hypothetical protein
VDLLHVAFAEKATVYVYYLRLAVGKVGSIKYFNYHDIETAALREISIMGLILLNH